MALARRLPAPEAGPAHHSRIRTGEWRWPALIAGVLLGVTLGPILIGWLMTPAGTTFTGFVVVGVDGPVYVADWRQGWAGAWLFHAMYTSDPVPPVLLYPWYVWGGHLVGGQAGPWLYHLARLASGVALLLAIYGLGAELFRPRRLRRLAFGLAVLGGGVGPFLGSSAQLGPVPFRATEMLVSGTSAGDLLSLAPHLPWAAALVCFLFTAALRYRKAPSGRMLVAALAAQLGLELIYPQVALLVVVVLVGLAVLHRAWPLLMLAGAAAAVLAPYIGYLGLVELRAPMAMRQVRFTFDLGDPFGFLVLSHLVATGLILAAFARRRLPQVLWLPGLWIGAMTVFMFTPGIAPVMGRTFLASSVPFGLMAAGALVVLRRRTAGRAWRRRLVALSLAGSSLFGLFSLGHPYAIAAGRLDAAAEYERTGEARLLAWVAPRTSRQTVILTTYLDGLFVPAQTNARAYVGHPDQTIDPARKARWAIDFFDTWPPEQRDAFLQANHIAYVLAPDPARVDRLRDDPMLRLVRESEGSGLFEVQP
jgi:hypothetical protein